MTNRIKRPQKARPLGTTGYDARGLVVAAGSEDVAGGIVNAVYFAHNGWRQLSTEAQVQDIPGTGGVTRTIQYGYAPGSAGSNTIRRTSLTYPSGQTSAPVLNYHYGSTGTDHGNALSRVSAIREGGTDIISYTWLGLSNPVDVNYNVPATHLSFGTAANHYDGLDRFGRPTTVQWLKGSDALVKAQYRYDRSSNRQWRYDAAAHAAGVATEDQWYEYDGLYQVREFQRGTLVGTYPSFSGITPVGQNQSWNYDVMGNWLGYTNDALNQTRQFNKVNEITSITGPSGVVTPLYDPTGNMTTMPAVDNWTTAQTLKWDAWNRLVKVSEGSTTIASYSYDALFRRVSKTTGTSRRLFYYSDDWQILEEYVGTASDPQVRYWYGLRDLNDIARRQCYSSGTFLHDDLYALRETMNIVALVDTSGAVQQRMAYDAFGNTRFLTGAWAGGSNVAAWAMLFHAHYMDSETGLYQMRFRCYHPKLGVWLSRDPIGEEGGLNQFSFAENKSINTFDILGLQLPTPLLPIHGTAMSALQRTGARPKNIGEIVEALKDDMRKKGFSGGGKCVDRILFGGHGSPSAVKFDTEMDNRTAIVKPDVNLGYIPSGGLPSANTMDGSNALEIGRYLRNELNLCCCCIIYLEACNSYGAKFAANRRYYARLLAEGSGCTVYTLRGEGGCDYDSRDRNIGDPLGAYVRPDGLYGANEERGTSEGVDKLTVGEKAWKPFFPILPKLF